MKPDREKFCVDAFERYLANLQRGSFREWYRVPRGQDPPDFYLNYEGTTFAVEVTSTKVMRDTLIDDGEVPEETYEASMRAMIRQLELITRESGTLQGSYVISFDQPIASEQFSQIKSILFARLQEIIKQARRQPKSWYQSIHINGQKLCSLYKLSEKPDRLYEAFEDFAWTETPEFLNYVIHLLREAIITKKTRLEEKGEKLPAILLLLNTYALAEPSTFLSFMNVIPERFSFHSIYLVNGNGTGMILFTEEKNW